jgi:hypothetical protein
MQEYASTPAVQGGGGIIADTISHKTKNFWYTSANIPKHKTKRDIRLSTTKQIQAFRISEGQHCGIQEVHKMHSENPKAWVGILS